MICVVIKGPSVEDIRRQLSNLHPKVDLIEFRIDCFANRNKWELEILLKECTFPFIFTLRDRSQGGSYLGDERKRIEEIRQLASLKPQYFDLESHLPLNIIQELREEYPEIKWIISYHQFEKRPSDLNEIFNVIKKIPGDLYKIVLQGCNTLDALKMLKLIKLSEHPLIGISMGEEGQISRILGEIFGSPLTYVCHEEDENNELGQLSANQLFCIYRSSIYNKNTEIYGLIGDPVTTSISHQTHNAFFYQKQINAIYVRMRIQDFQLGEFFQLAKELNIRGLSVTMPLKEKVIPYIDVLEPSAQNILAVNTVKIWNDKIYGFNTDGVGALDAVEKFCLLRNKSILILGIGGAAKAIIYEALNRGAIVFLYNRTFKKAKDLKERYLKIGKQVEVLKNLEAFDYDILINCTSVDNPIDPEDVLREKIVMDIKTFPFKNPFTESAKKKNCRVVYGYEMFINQALGQFKIWFGDLLSWS